MMHHLYNLSMHCMALGLRVAAPFHPKIRLGYEGRRHWRQLLAKQVNPLQGKRLWVHVASLGEFEQGRPFIEAFRLQYPDWQVVLTFFSPSGFELRKNYAHAEVVAYLPIDTPANARDFLDLVRPNLVVFVKYEFWANYLLQTHARGIPLLLIAALFRPDQPFFKAYGHFGRRVLQCFSHIFVQTPDAAALLHSIGYLHTTVAGDTRIDRVLQIAAAPPPNPTVAHFASGNTVLIVGSSWLPDEDALITALRHPALATLKVVCAPHTPTPEHVQRLVAALDNTAVTYTAAIAQPELLERARWLIIDNVGMLNTLYQYGHIAYIGGGFGTGIHNTLEPAAFGLPIVFGPRYHKFEEARQLIACGGGFVVHNADSLQQVLLGLMADYPTRGGAARQYLVDNCGGTAIVLAKTPQIDQMPHSVNIRPPKNG